MPSKPSQMDRVLDRIPSPWKERLTQLGDLATERQLPLCLVGGCVRDLILQREPKDWDLMVEGPAAALVKEACEKMAATSRHHPTFLTYTLTFEDGGTLDVATARQETYPEPGALPVVEAGTLEKDFARRDFTVNAMAIHMTTKRWGELEDPFKGWEDLKKGVIRVLHEKSFEDDPTRLYRAARYAGRYDWVLERDTQDWVLKAIKQKFVHKVSPARLRTELELFLGERDPRPGLELLWEWGAWVFWSAQWSWSSFLEENLGKIEGHLDRPLFRLMVLNRFLTPAEAQAELVRLTFPNAVVGPVKQALKLLALSEEGKWEPGVSEKISPTTEFFLSQSLKEPLLVERWKKSIPELNGRDLQDLGYAPGPLYKEVLEALGKARWEGRIANRADELRYVVEHFPKKT